jgi:ferritin-like metal-binding protein YciE
MGLFTKDIRSMDDLFLHTLRDLYYAEQQIVRALPDMIDKATDPDLAAGFKHHLDETRQHVSRLEEVFRQWGQEPKDVDCPAIDGILDEADEIAGEVEDKTVLDAALIAAAQSVEHYEITRYGTLIAWANQRGDTNVVSLLKRTLDEERQTDEKLTALAESRINQSAA